MTNLIKIALLGLASLWITGCSLNTNTYLHNLSNSPKLPYGESTTSADPCRDWSSHVLAINARGEFKPVRFKHPTCMDAQANTKLEEHIEQIVTAIRRSNINHLLFFIHGGMNSYDDSTARIDRDLPAMLKDGYYPIFILWPSSPFDSYGDSLVNYYQGSWDNEADRLWTPFPLKLATDLAEIGAKSALTYSKQFYLYGSSFCYNENWRNYTPGNYCGNYPAKPNSEEFIPSKDPCQEPIETKGFECLQNTAAAAIEFDMKRLKYLLLNPIKYITIPVFEPLGHRAWNSMISRTRFAMRKPCKDDFWGKGDCGDGVVFQLFDKLKDQLGGKTLTLIGHSMGAIVASGIVKQFPDLPYENIVFLGAAVSIREYADTVERVLVDRLNYREIPEDKCPIEGDGIKAQKNKPFKFYNVSLHPYAEASEENLLGAAPAGSLLEWIDTNFTQPADLADRTMGRWANIAPLWKKFNQCLIKNDYVHFKRFALDLNGPHTHGGLADTNQSGSYGAYWKPQYWYR